MLYLHVSAFGCQGNPSSFDSEVVVPSCCLAKLCSSQSLGLAGCSSSAALDFHL